jgi:hypothetical protein
MSHLIIKNLLEIQAIEVQNNFANGDLWNNCEDMINNIKMYGQTNDPQKIYDQNGYEIGFQLNNGLFYSYGNAEYSLNCQ